VQDRQVACRTLVELAYADALAGRRPDAQTLLAEALDLADGDPARLAAVRWFEGFNLADWGHYDEAFLAYDCAL
jgi:hypothetical protein